LNHTNVWYILMGKELTEVQKNILEFIIEQKSLRGYPPTLAEIASRFKYKNRATVQQHLGALETKGYIKRNFGLARGLELTLEDKFFVPRPVLGEVAAGNPLTIYPDSIDTVEMPTIARMPRESFLLKVKGDSLKDAFIFSGDIVIVNPALDVRNGAIVAAVLDDAAVVKRFFRRKDRIELVSENPEYQPIVIEKTYQKFKIVGVVVGIYRSMIKNKILQRDK
jgi:repressor LexA